MGQCVSVVPPGKVPRCKTCGKEASKPWGRLNLEERAHWMWQGQTVCCRKCTLTQKIDKIKYERERKQYAKAKEEMYPKPTEGVKPLKKLGEGEAWDNSSSFYSGWKPPSSLRRLLSAIRLAQAEDPKQYVGLQRKPTGYVPPTAPPALQDGLQQPAEVGQSGQGTPAERQQQISSPLERPSVRGRAELASLEEEEGIEMVEELSLGRPSMYVLLEEEEGEEERDGEEDQGQPQQTEQQRQQGGPEGAAAAVVAASGDSTSSTKQSASCHGDSAFRLDDDVACGQHQVANRA